MTENGLLLQKKSDRLFSGIVTLSVLVISLIFASACVQSSEPGDYYTQGIYYNNHNNQYDKALEYFNKSVKSEPGNPRVWFARSVALYNLKRYDESLESLNTTIGIDPDYEGAGLMREEILSAMAKADEANSVQGTSEILINTTPSAGKGSVSNLDIIPAGTFAVFHETNVSAEQNVTCNVSGCIQSNDTREGGSPQDTQPSASVDRADAVAIALNDSEVQDYLRNGYTLGNVGPLCYERSMSDQKIYKLCFIGVEFYTRDVFLVVYVDLKKGEVNKTSVMYNRNPVVPENTSVIPR